MMGIPAYQPLAALDTVLAQDDRSHRIRLEEFFVRVCATARSSSPHIGRQSAFLGKDFHVELPAFALGILRDSFDIIPFEDFEDVNHGNHSFGDVSKIMAAGVTFVSYADIMTGCLFKLTFFQYLAPGSVLVCVQHGRSGAVVPAGLEVLTQYFSSPHDLATAKFLRVARQWQSQLQA